MRKRFRNLRAGHLSVVLAIAFLAACGSGAGAPSADSAAGAASSLRPDRHGLVQPAAGLASAEVMSAPAAMSPAAGADLAPQPAAARNTSSASAFSATPALASVDPTGAMLVRQGQASIEVKRVDDAVGRVRQAAAQAGGFVANATVRGGRDETRAATLEVRVPSAQFDALVGALGGLGKVESVTAAAQDVGDEYVDLTARAMNARRLEARLIEMLATRTGKLSDVLTMEQELARVREEIERYEGRLKHLERTATLSTLSISLHEPLPLLDRPHPDPIAGALGEAWNHMVGVLAWCIAALGVVIPLGLLVLAAVLVVRWGMRRLDRAAVAGG